MRFKIFLQKAIVILKYICYNVFWNIMCNAYILKMDASYKTDSAFLICCEIK